MSGPVVLKVGGSLLDWSALPDRLGPLLVDRQPKNCVILVGGGRVVDAIRDLDRAHGLDQDRAHALAIRALDLTAHILADLIPATRVVERLADLPPAWSQGLIPILAPRHWLVEDDRSPDALPHHWDVTSDAIAARLAVRLQSPELVLLKSAPCPDPCDRELAARLGLVDPAFPEVSRAIPRVLYLDLRNGTEGPWNGAIPLTISRERGRESMTNDR